MEEEYLLEVWSTDDWAKETSSDLDNAFGNLLRGNNTDGYTVVLYEEGERKERYPADTEQEVEETVEKALDQEGLDPEEVEIDRDPSN